MRAYEGLAAAYFGVLAVASLAAPGRPRPRAGLLALAMSGVVGAVSFGGSEGLRAWAPHVYLVAGYWLPAVITRAPVFPTPFERWLQWTDAVLRPASGRLPPFLQHLTELAYLLCYPLVPLSFAIVWTAGSSADVERFWMAILAAGYACYVSLPWLVSRPPRLIAGATRHPIGNANVFVLGRVSHELNTFPSGHVAVALAAAASVWTVSPISGAVVATTALAIAVGAAAGRYHYVVDILLGVLVGAAATVLAFT